MFIITIIPPVFGEIFRHFIHRWNVIFTHLDTLKIVYSSLQRSYNEQEEAQIHAAYTMHAEIVLIETHQNVSKRDGLE